MNVLDYIVLALLVANTVIGILKGFLKQLLAIVGVFVIATLTATLTPIVQNWLVNVIANDGVRSAVAMIVAVLLLGVGYSFLATLLLRILKKIHILKLVDRILGGVIGFAVVYLVFAVIFALFNNTSESFLASIKGWAGESFQNSWFATHIYANNFFGDWIINGIAEKLLNSLQPAA